MGTTPPIGSPVGSPRCTTPVEDQLITLPANTATAGSKLATNNIQTSVHASNSSSNPNQVQPIAYALPPSIASLDKSGTRHTFPLNLANAQTIQADPNNYSYFGSTSLTPRNQDITVQRLGDVTNLSDANRYVFRVDISNANATSVPGDSINTSSRDHVLQSIVSLKTKKQLLKLVKE